MQKLIKVKSHKRNGRIVRSHMKKSLKKKVKSALADYTTKYGPNSNKQSHPKTGAIRAAIMDVTTKSVKRKNRPSYVRGKYTNTHNFAGTKRKHNL